MGRCSGTGNHPARRGNSQGPDCLSRSEKEISTKLYHGTSEEHLESILGRGVLPGDLVGKSNWNEQPARSGIVYLTSTLAWMFALGAADHHAIDGDLEAYHDYSPLYHPAILEVDVSTENLLPDEDFLGQRLYAEYSGAGTSPPYAGFHALR